MTCPRCQQAVPPDAGTGKRQEAAEHLTTAITMYGEMDMRFWPAQAEAELKEVA